MLYGERFWDGTVKIMRAQLFSVTMFLVVFATVLMPRFTFAEVLQGTHNGTVFAPSQAAVEDAAVTVVNDATETRVTTTRSDVRLTVGGEDQSIPVSSHAVALQTDLSANQLDNLPVALG